MSVPSIHRFDLVSAVLFVVSTTALALQVISPSAVLVTGGESGASLELARPCFRGTIVTAIAASVFGGSGTYLLVGADRSEGPAAAQRDRENDSANARTGGDPLDTRRREWEETADRLAGNERAVYEAVLEADGALPQSDVVDRTDLSKATVSRTLDSLEAKRLLERKRRGVGNVVVLR